MSLITWPTHALYGAAGAVLGYLVGYWWGSWLTHKAEKHARGEEIEEVFR